MNAVQRGGKHQFGTGEKQAKGDLIGQRRALDMAGAQTEAHGGGIGSDQSQTTPARYKAIMFGALDHPVVELREGAQGWLGARLREGLLRDVAHQLRLLPVTVRSGAAAPVIDCSIAVLSPPIAASSITWSYTASTGSMPP